MITDDELIALTAAENGITVDDLTGRERNSRLTLIRMQAARRLRGRGHSPGAVGKRIGKDRWTVLYYLAGGSKGGY